MKLGDLSRFSDPETALVDYQQGLGTFDSLPSDELKRPANLRFRAQFLRKVGGTLRDLQQFKEAEPYLNRSLAFFEESLATDPDDKRAKYDLVIISEAVMLFYEAQGKTGRARLVSERMVSLMDDLIRSEPANTVWHMSHGYYRYKLATQLAKLGEQGSASSIGAESLNELARAADPSDASPQALELATEAFARIEPRALRNRERAVRYAERLGKLRPAQDLTALYLLAVAQNADGASREAIETAHRALALLPPTRSGHVYYLRGELESIN
jgi:tetratricopeptide (TPR) repeat protein